MKFSFKTFLALGIINSIGITYFSPTWASEINWAEFELDFKRDIEQPATIFPLYDDLDYVSSNLFDLPDPISFPALCPQTKQDSQESFMDNYIPFFPSDQNITSFEDSLLQLEDYAPLNSPNLDDKSSSLPIQQSVGTAPHPKKDKNISGEILELKTQNVYKKRAPYPSRRRLTMVEKEQILQNILNDINVSTSFDWQRLAIQTKSHWDPQGERSYSSYADFIRKTVEAINFPQEESEDLLNIARGAHGVYRSEVKKRNCAPDETQPTKRQCR